ncbi:MAG: esterase-like activity of phytase family protein [Flavobacteriaceae bacterium]
MKNLKITVLIIAIATLNSCGNSTTVDKDAISTTLDYSKVETFGSALADQVNAGDGAGIDKIFRNSGVVIDESDSTYFAVNGVHPVKRGDLTSYYPKSVVKASLVTDKVVKAYSFSGHNGHEVDMEGLTFGAQDGYLYIGDEYNYVYKMNLSTGAIEQEWDLATIGISTRADKGIEAIAYSKTTKNYYVGIQALKSVIEINLKDDGTIKKINEFAVPDSPSGLFAHPDGTLYVLTFKSIYRFDSKGIQTCKISIPKDLGMTRPDGIYIDSNNEYIYLADSQGPLKGGHSMYKIAWTKPCK